LQSQAMASVPRSPNLPSGNYGWSRSYFRDRFREYVGEVFIIVLAKFRKILF
jgi:hypothetical protein